MEDTFVTALFLLGPHLVERVRITLSYQFGDCFTTSCYWSTLSLPLLWTPKLIRSGL